MLHNTNLTPDDEQIFSKHVEAYNKLIIKQNFKQQFG